MEVGCRVNCGKQAAIQGAKQVEVGNLWPSEREHLEASRPVATQIDSGLP